MNQKDISIIGFHPWSFKHCHDQGGANFADVTAEGIGRA